MEAREVCSSGWKCFQLGWGQKRNTVLFHYVEASQNCFCFVFVFAYLITIFSEW
ncbi:hypothetical protein GE21DRAFT_1221132 [Neurospora crassa]|nr:hypothetical protein GE21DRAFT_1221132 [Neurospora crassa]